MWDLTIGCGRTKASIPTYERGEMINFYEEGISSMTRIEERGVEGVDFIW